MGRIPTVPPHDAHGESVGRAFREGIVFARQSLICDLPPAFVSARAGVDDLISKIFVVLVAA